MQSNNISIWRSAVTVIAALLGMEYDCDNSQGGLSKLNLKTRQKQSSDKKSERRHLDCTFVVCRNMAYDFYECDKGQKRTDDNRKGQNLPQGVKKSVLKFFEKIAWELLCSFRDFWSYLKYFQKYTVSDFNVSTKSAMWIA